FFERTLSLDPDERPDASALAEALDVLLEPERRRARRRSVLSIVLPLLVIAALATGLVYSTLTREVREQRDAAGRAEVRAGALEADLDAAERAREDVANEAARIAALLARGRASNEELSSRLGAAQQSLTEASARIDVLD